MTLRRIVLSGCSGGGKSTLLAELARRGHATMPEPGRDILRAELASGGTALPWTDPVAFARRCLARATEQFDAATGPGPVLYDRAIIDAVTALACHGPLPPDVCRLAETRRYDIVFLLPPWPELFAQDAERRHDFDAAVAEYDTLCAAWPAWGYVLRDVPPGSLAWRADLVEAALRAF